jgi:hypothetical protein
VGGDEWRQTPVEVDATYGVAVSGNELGSKWPRVALCAAGDQERKQEGAVALSHEMAADLVPACCLLSSNLGASRQLAFHSATPGASSLIAADGSSRAGGALESVDSAPWIDPRELQRRGWQYFYGHHVDVTQRV